MDTLSRGRDRWYMLGMLTLVYALNIADRFSISTLIEPIKTELALSDASVAFLTGVALAIFYVSIGIPVATLADRANRRNIIAVARAQACAVLLFTANIANLVLAPQLIGIMSDQLATAGLGRESLRWALIIVAPTGWRPGICGPAGARFAKIRRRGGACVIPPGHSSRTV